MRDLEEEVRALFAESAGLGRERFPQRAGFQLVARHMKRTLAQRRRQSAHKRAKYAADLELSRREAREKYARQMQDPAFAEKRRVRLRQWMRDKRAMLRGEDVKL